ncbi:vivapain-2 [Plasmodium ovale wallikeri]|uniref:Vivapain-2 n=2 Tax=Plasmodium ovale TaxID=36330 RepID=A0A1A8YV52_PLAOA|nr:vivapain-2 [Plasmodium ovale wallikeri]SBT35502.1 vivapain-2 [Plasmodium ovale wallikeri]SBT77033.1 vivapain-2, putative [Plasmodium ovale]
MEYHMEYSTNESIKPEKEAFVDKGIDRKVLKKKRNIFIILSVSAICIFACSIFYFTRPTSRSDMFNNSSEQDVNDDYIISSLLKSKSGKKFIVSKIEELILLHDKNNNGQVETESSLVTIGDDNNSKGNTVSHKKRFGNLKVAQKNDIINFFDTKFLMTNLESVNAFYIFMKEHGKKYTSADEMEKKFIAFSENIAKINAHNNSNSLYKKGINQFADLTYDEFKKKFLTLKKFSSNKYAHKFSNLINYYDVINKYKPEDAIVEDVNYDWRLHGGVTPVKDQANCGSCWAFSAVGSIESQYAIRKNEVVSLSEQELVDCSSKNFGCFGGLVPLAFEDMIELGGLCSEEEYPYVDLTPEMCYVNKCKKKLLIKSYLEIPEDKYKEAIQFLGPLSVGIAADDDFIFYKGGIFNGYCADELNHAVMLVGYGMEEMYNNKSKQNEKYYYYILKNSWGKTWGEGGYMRIKTDELGLRKTCSLSEAFVPLLD